jgi:tetratricopeptide (TPR) repeat protein
MLLTIAVMGRPLLRAAPALVLAALAAACTGVGLGPSRVGSLSDRAAVVPPPASARRGLGPSRVGSLSDLIHFAYFMKVVPEKGRFFHGDGRDLPARYGEFDPDTDPQVVFYVALSQRRQTFGLRVQLYAPSGELIDVSISRMSQKGVATTWEHSAFAFMTGDLKQAVVKERAGDWKLELFIDEALAGRYSFRLKPSHRAVAGRDTMSVDEARQVVTSTRGGAFVPPPRTIEDVTAILDQQPRFDPEQVAREQAQADQPVPATDDAATLARFYSTRGRAAGAVGRTRQEIEDLTRAVEYARKSSLPDLDLILYSASNAEVAGGSLSRGLGFLRQAIEKVPRERYFFLIDLHANVAYHHARMGDVEAADEALGKMLSLLRQSRGRTSRQPERVATSEAMAAWAQATVRQARGQLIDAETFFRRAITILEGHPSTQGTRFADVQSALLAWVLARQGRLVEAEAEARKSTA